MNILNKERKDIIYNNVAYYAGNIMPWLFSSGVICITLLLSYAVDTDDKSTGSEFMFGGCLLLGLLVNIFVTMPILFLLRDFIAWTLWIIFKYATGSK